MRIYCFLSLILLISFPLYGQGLPHYMTQKEKELYKTYVPPIYFSKDVNPPSSPVRTMAEWEELQGLLITWTGYPSILRQIVDYAQEEVIVYIVCDDSNSVKSNLTSYGIPLYNISYIEAEYNAIWCRDYGPWSIYKNNVHEHSIVDWIYNRPYRPYDNLIPGVLADYLDLPIYQTIASPNNLIHTGGNFMTDGHGTGFSSNLILEENPGKTEAEIDTIMKNYMGINRYIKMNTLPYDGIHHIDMHIKLIDEETLLVGQYPQGVADGPQIETNLQYILNNFQTCYNRPYKVVRIPMPPDYDGSYPDTWGDYRTYTNSVIVNKTVIVPTYTEEYDTTALRIYQEAMPGYNIVGIPCTDIIGSLGAIHCISKEIGVNDPILISHAPLYDQPDTTSNYLIETKIQSSASISEVCLNWKTSTMESFNQLTMTVSENDTFFASIPQQPANEKIQYYISATNSNNKTISKPLTAPDGFWEFTIEQITFINNDNIALDETFTLNQNYPNPFNPNTRISYSLTTPGNIKLIIYNSIGQKIKTLVNKNQNSGEYYVSWDGTDFNSFKVSSGIYFYRLNVNNMIITKKMLLLK
ncbi:MAG: agmatine deiminase family protein [Calditrichia bacterium]|nr:agmatine deiminase family protein [Calditrichia bacterium]